MRRRTLARAGKWTFAAVAGLIAAAWLVSGWRLLEWRCFPAPAEYDVRLVFGCVKYRSVVDPVIVSTSEPGWPGRLRLDALSRYGLRTPFWQWGIHVSRSGTTGRRSQTDVTVPLWPAFLVATGLALGCRRVARHKPGHCPRCGYDLTATPGSTCPECGSGQQSTT
jgi:hypothetical protein